MGVTPWYEVAGPTAGEHRMLRSITADREGKTLKTRILQADVA
jgi:hypothetical protein